MARTSKTNLGGKVDTDAMLRAGEARKGVTDARFKSGAASERTLDRTIAGAGAADRAIEFDTLRNEREAAEKTRVAENEAISTEDKRRFELQEGRASEQHEMDIHARGLQRTQEGPQSEGDKRAAQTEEEMAKGAGQGEVAPGPTEEQRRRQEQGQKPLEHTGARTGFGGFETRPEVAEQQTYDARTSRIEAEGDRAEAMAKFLKATRDPGTTPEDLRSAKAQLEKPIAIAMKTFDDVRANLGITPEARSQAATLGEKPPADLDWRNMQDSFGGVADPDFQAEMQAQTVGPAMVRFFGNQTALRVAEMAAGTGEWPDSKFVDTTNPLIRDIQAEVNRQNEFAKMVGMKARDIADKMQRLTSAAGWVVLKSLEQNPQAMQQGGGSDRQPEPAPGGAAPVGSRGEPGQPAYQPADVDQQQDHPGYEGRELDGRGYAVQKNTRAKATLGPMGSDEDQKPGSKKNWDWAKDLPK